jgi:hypothetical protein
MDIDGLETALNAKGTMQSIDIYPDFIGIWYNDISGTKQELDSIVLQYVGDTYSTLDSSLEYIPEQGNRYKCRAK